MLSLNSHIASKRNQIESEKEKLRGLRAELKKLRKEIRKYTKPYHATAKFKAEKRIRDIEENIKNIESGEKLKAYEDKIQPYIRAHAQQEEEKEMEKSLGMHSRTFEGIPTIRKQQQSLQKTVTESYLICIEKKAPAIQIEIKPSCKECNEEMLHDPVRSIIACPMCGTSKEFLDATSASTAYGNEVEISPFAYKRITHFKERLTYFQAKESTKVPDDVLEDIHEELYKKGKRNSKQITLKDIQDVLKKLQLRKFYRCKTQILSKLTGIPPPRLTHQQEKQYISMFNQIQEPFFEFRPKSRKNFLSYSYCLYRFSQYLGYHHFLPYFGLLKGPEKLNAQDAIFKQICNKLGWPLERFSFHR